jgi:membrane protein
MLIQFSPSQLYEWADKQTPQHDRSVFHRFAHTLCRIILITVQEFRKNELSLRAAALTFTVMLSLVPILAMSTAVVKGLGGGDQLKTVVYSYVSTLEGGGQQTSDSAGGDTATATKKESSSNLTEHLYSAIDKLFAYVERTNFATLGTFGMAGIFLSVILVLGNIEMAMNAIWHVHSGRSAMRKIADYLALLVLMPISINIGIAAGTILKNDTLLSKFNIILPFAWMQALILKLIPILFLALTLYVIYLFFPNTKVKTIPAMVGALFAGFFWFQVQNVYISMQVGVANYNAIYGSFATLPLFLVWIYFGWIFILAGAQIAYAYQHKDSFHLTSKESPASMRLAIAYDILDYVQQCFEEEQNATSEGFAEKYPMHDQRIIGDTLNQLQKQGLIHQTEENQFLKPSLPRQRVDYKKVVQAIVGAEYSETEGGKKSNLVLNAVDAPLPFTTENIDNKQ